MISADDFYKVMCAMVPLYSAMLVAYVSVKWCKIFSPEQCSGINRFVAVFAVPILSFHFISQNNPYQMDTKFILADTLSKASVLGLLSIWCIFKGQLEWLITMFSVSTLPNTLVMGIPLLKAMYGEFTESLMVQLVVLQCIIWYTLLLFLFEYRAATILIQTQFPGQIAAAITKFDVDNDVISLDGRDPLCTDSEIDDAGRIIRVRIRRSTSSAAPSSSMGLTPRASNLSNAEIFSINTPHEFGLGYRPTSPRFSGYASSDAYSLQPTPRASNFNEMDSTSASPVAAGKVFRQPSPAVKILWESPSEVHGVFGTDDGNIGDKDLSFRDCAKIPLEEGSTNQEMPRAIVMLRLILIVVGRKLSRNPNTYSSVLGLLWSLISFKWNVGMPSLVKYSIKIISDAGLGMAMFSLGLFMALQPRIIACGIKMGIISMAIRFFVGPILMSAASLAVGLKGVHLHAAIVQAALPQGIVPFVFAREYGLHPDILSTGVIFAAVAWEAGKPLVIEEVEVAPPQKMEVRIKILFTSLCHTDVYFWEAKGQTPLFPRIFGHEAGGIVESVGEGVTDLKPGDHVLPVFTGECKECRHCKSSESNMCDLLRINTDRGIMINDGKTRFSKNGQPIYHFVGTSTFSEYTVVHVGCLAKINPAAPLDKVCVLSCGISTGLGATLNVAKPTKGSTVAIFGLGAVGLAAAEGARIAGASRIIGVDLNSSRFNEAKKFGVTEFVNPKDYDKPVQEVIAEMTDGGVDRSVECTGNINAMISAFECVHDGWGVAVLVGVPNKDDAFKTHPVNVLNERTLKGTFFGNYKPRSDIPDVVEKYMNKELELDKFITHQVPFSDINKAFDYMLRGEGLRCIIHMEK